MRESGRFIVIEGLDGAGTTTQARLLARHLRRAGREVVLTHQPSPGPIGCQLRAALRLRLTGTDGARLDPRAMAALFVADRADHLRGVIEPALASGHDVVCDRYLYSSLAYQGVECDLAWVAAINAPFLTPDLVLYLRVPVEVAAARRAARKGTPEIYEVDEVLRDVAAGYDRLKEVRPSDPIITIDGARSVRAVQRECQSAVAGSTLSEVLSCAACGGTGRVERVIEGSNALGSYRVLMPGRCPTCRGGGKVPR